MPVCLGLFLMILLFVLPSGGVGLGGRSRSGVNGLGLGIALNTYYRERMRSVPANRKDNDKVFGGARKPTEIAHFREAPQRRTPKAGECIY